MRAMLTLVADYCIEHTSAVYFVGQPRPADVPESFIDTSHLLAYLLSVAHR